MRWQRSLSPLSCGCHRSVCLANVCRNHGTIAKDCRRVSWCRWFFSLAQTVVHFGTALVTHFAMFSFFLTGGVTSTLHKLRFKQHTTDEFRVCAVWIWLISERVCRDVISWFFPRRRRKGHKWQPSLGRLFLRSARGATEDSRPRDEHVSADLIRCRHAWSARHLCRLSASGSAFATGCRKKDQCIPFLTGDAQVGFVHGGTAVWGIAVASCSASRKHSVMESPPLDPRRPQCPRKTEMRHGLQSQPSRRIFFSSVTRPSTVLPGHSYSLTSSFPALASSSWTTCTRALGGEKERGERAGRGRRGRRGRKGGGWSRLVAGLRQFLSESASCRRLMRGSPQKPRS